MRTIHYVESDRLTQDMLQDKSQSIIKYGRLERKTQKAYSNVCVIQIYNDLLNRRYEITYEAEKVTEITETRYRHSINKDQEAGNRPQEHYRNVHKR